MSNKGFVGLISPQMFSISTKLRDVRVGHVCWLYYLAGIQRLCTWTLTDSFGCKAACCLVPLS